MYSKKDFLLAARERLRKAGGSARYVYTRHAEYKMREYRLSRQKVEGVIRRPTRIEGGVATDTVAVMSPVSPKTEKGRQVWKQEVWVMYVRKSVENGRRQAGNAGFRPETDAGGSLKIISAWRYPGVSPARDPIPAEILREIEEGSILDEADNP